MMGVKLSIQEMQFNATEGGLGQALVDGILRAGFDVVTGVPDSPLAPVTIALEKSENLYYPGLREDTCLAWAAGTCMAGRVPLVMMKSAGFANCLDSLTSLVEVYGLPIVLLISWAGYRGRDIPHHNVIGEPLKGLLEILGIPAIETSLADPQAVGAALAAALSLARERRGAAAILGIPEGLLAK
jgi:phosphonopyruvate decarboxylase